MACVNFNMNKNSGFGDINNCNSLDISVVSSPTVNSIRMNSFYKLTNVLLLLFLLFGSSVVSFGMDGHETLTETGQAVYSPVNIAPRNRYLYVPTAINKISMLFLTKVMSVDEGAIKDKIYKGGKLVYWFYFLGLNDIHALYQTNIANNLWIVFLYPINTIVLQSCYRGIFSVKPCFKKIKEGGNCELYFGVGNVPYVGGLFNLSLVCKPTFILKYFPTFLQDKVTIHIIDFKPFNFILGCVFSTLLILYTKCKRLYIRPQWIVGFCTVEIKIAKYYNISLNFGSWILDLIMFMKYTRVNEIKGSL